MFDIIDIIDGYNETKPNSIAHINRQNELTYKDLVEKSNALAAYLIDKFSDNKTPLIVYGHKQNEMLICFLACIKSGHPYIPLDSSTPKERILEIIKNSITRLVLCIEDLDCKLSNIETIEFESIHNVIEKFKGTIPEKKYRVKENDTYYIIYTSGSTGKPKGVEITLSCLKSFIKWILKIYKFDLNSKYVFMNQAPFSFDLSVMELYTSLITGSTLFSIDKRMISNSKELFEWLKKSNVNVWISTPSFAEMCLTDKLFNDKFLNIKLFLFCGEPLMRQCVNKLHERFTYAKVINMYGPTECTVAVTSIEIDKEIKSISPLPVGKVKEGCNIIISDSSGKKVQDGKCGEIIIIGDSVGKGYYNNDELTNKYFFKINIDGVEKKGYKTGDKGFIKDKNLYCIGRLDFQVKMNGFRIELGDIENNLRKVSIVENCVVIPFVKYEKIHHLVAFVILNKILNEKDFKIGLIIKSELKKFLPKYMLPKKTIIVKNFPITSNGKIDRMKLISYIK